MFMKDKLFLVTGCKSYEYSISQITLKVIIEKLKDMFELHLIIFDTNNKPFYVSNKDILETNKYFKRSILFTQKGFIYKKFIKITCAFLVGHGSYIEDGRVASMFELYNIPTINSDYLGLASTQSKLIFKDVLVSRKIKTLDNYNKSNIKFPCIVKPDKLGSSLGIEVLSCKEELHKISKVLLYDNKFLIEDYVSDFREFNVALYKIKDQFVYSKVEEVFSNSNIYTFDEKYNKSSIDKLFIKDNKIIDAMKVICSEVYNSFDLFGIVRIDIIFINDEIYVNEVNSIPGSLSHYMFDIDFASIVNDLIVEKKRLINVNSCNKASILLDNVKKSKK